MFLQSLVDITLQQNGIGSPLFRTCKYPKINIYLKILYKRVFLL